MLPEAMSQGVLQPDQLVGGRYRVRQLLGHGGMAVVYRARHTSTDKLCALKVVRPDLATRRDILELFVKEAKLGAKIGDHPNIVNVFDAGIDEPTGRPFLAMELLDGETLEQRLERGPLPPGVVRTLLRQLADALTQAHEAGVVHRDLKPSNLFLVEDRRGSMALKVMDFGIAKVLGPEAQRTATLAGTPTYAAPEQMGDQARQLARTRGLHVSATITPATDVWAMGLLTYEMLTGLPPDHYWDAEDAGELARRVLLEQLPSPSRRAEECQFLVPPGFDAWFARALARDASDRWPTARAAADAVDPLLADAALTAAQASATIPALPRELDAGALPVAATLDERPAWVAATAPRGLTQPIAPAPIPKTICEEPDLAADVEDLHRHVVAEPRNPKPLEALYAALGGDVDRRIQVAQVLEFLGAADGEQLSLHRAAQTQELIRPTRPLDAAAWEKLLKHPDEDAVTGEILTLAAAPIARSHVAARRQSSTQLDGDPARVLWGRDRTERMINRCFSWAAEIMASNPPRLFDYRDQPGLTRISIAASLPPDVRLCRGAFERRRPRELAFAAGRCLAALRPERVLLSLLPDLRHLEDVFLAGLFVAAPRLPLPTDVATRIGPVTRAIRRFLPSSQHAALRQAADRFSARGGRTDLRKWAAGAERTAARAGLLLSNDLAAAARMLDVAEAPHVDALVDDLIGFITSAHFRSLRAAMGMAPPLRPAPTA